MTGSPSATTTPDGPASGDAARIELDLDSIEKEALAGDGNYLYKVDVDGRAVVLKIYYGNRSPVLYWKKTFGNVVLTGRSSHMPRARFRVEMASLDAWEKHGFRCFERLPHVRIKGLPDDGYMAFEYTPGRHFREYFRDASIPVEERLETWCRWVPEWHRRHRIAVETGDQHLIHENGDVKHVMLWEGDFVYFDFEMIYTSKDVRLLVGREILAYMRSVGRFYGEEMYQKMLAALIEHYPDKSLLLAAWEVAWHHPNPLMRFARMLDRALKPANRKRWSKYRIGLDLKDALGDQALNVRWRA